MQNTEMIRRVIDYFHSHLRNSLLLKQRMCNVLKSVSDHTERNILTFREDHSNFKKDTYP